MNSKRLIFTSIITLYLVLSTSHNSNINIKGINGTFELSDNNIVSKKYSYNVEKKVIMLDNLSFRNKIIITDDKKYTIKSNSYFDNYFDIGIHNQVCTLENDKLSCMHVNEYQNISTSIFGYLIKYSIMGIIFAIYIYVLLS